MKRLLVLELLLISLAFGLAAGFVTYDQLFAEVSLTGSVVDAENGKPITDASLFIGSSVRSPVAVGADGTFELHRVRRRTILTAEAAGYLSASVPVDRIEHLDVSLTPRSLSGTVRDSYTDSPVSHAILASGPISTTTRADGSYYLSRFPEGTPVVVTATGYARTELPSPTVPSLDIKLRPDTLTGKVSEVDSGRPITGAQLQTDAATSTTDAGGMFRLEGVPSAFTLTVSAPGYKRQQIAVGQQTTIDIAMEPFVVRAPYVTFFGIGNKAMRQRVLNLIESTELNGVVIDLKGDRGLVAYKSDVPLAAEIGAQNLITLPDVDELLAYLKKRGIYAIARIVVFKDDPLGRAHPEWTIKDKRTGQPWVDGEGLIWMDPFRREVWDYNIALAKEAIRKGFDEVQFDYTRFPTDPSASTSVDNAVYSRPNTAQNRVEAISGFLGQARAELKPLGGVTSVDVFGYACWRDDDMGIGQHLETLAQYVDYISPMVYPSTFAGGLPTDPISYQNAPAHPYEIVFYSLEKAVNRIKGTGARIRPWLQYFDDYPWATARVYTEKDIEAEKKAASDAQASGWMLWDPFVDYDKGGLAKRQPAPDSADKQTNNR
ncbi:MAG: carboxypeptidase regulatory-like domain-containing protein [Bacteroidetes bacterium]|nr:carboxypeptidase regulatory-like domain-containing protein [Bacteroidota bacterium]MCL5025652.1 carboxypeptidase regulatory-like domain-containing protein [Chloroflexota bacterium]